MTEPQKRKFVLFVAAGFLLLLLIAGIFYPDGSHPDGIDDRDFTAKEVNPKNSDADTDSPATEVGLTLGVPIRPEIPAETREVLRIELSEQIRLNPGETAVLSFLKLDPGLNGVLLVTPAPDPDGNVPFLDWRLLDVTDEAIEKVAATDLFPDIFSTDRASVIDPLRLNVLLDAVQNVEGATNTAMPRVMIEPGIKATFRSVITNPGSEWRGTKIGTVADPLEGGGFDLSLDYTWQGDSP